MIPLRSLIRLDYDIQLLKQAEQKGSFSDMQFGFKEKVGCTI